MAAVPTIARQRSIRAIEPRVANVIRNCAKISAHNRRNYFQTTFVPYLGTQLVQQGHNIMNNPYFSNLVNSLSQHDERTLLHAYYLSQDTYNLEWLLREHRYIFRRLESDIRRLAIGHALPVALVNWDYVQLMWENAIRSGVNSSRQILQQLQAESPTVRFSMTHASISRDACAEYARLQRWASVPVQNRFQCNF
jgi:hypothetical protein